MFILLALLYPRLMVRQILFKLDRAAHQLEEMSMESKRRITRYIARRPRARLRKRVANFFEFFIISPVSLDPYGLIQKLEHVILLSEQRFKQFVREVAPHLDPERQANLRMSLATGISLYNLAKLLRHFVELIKKTGSMQLALIVQMQLPLIRRLSKALVAGTEAIMRGWPIGDSIGSLIGAHLIGNARFKEIMEDTIMARRRIKGRKVIVLKARGPGSRIGRLGRAVERLVKRRKVAKIIMIDAATKLEGERTGAVARGIGAAIGGVGVDRAFIEEVATKKGIPLESVIIKLSREEGIQPMRSEILAARRSAIEMVEEIIYNTPKDGDILVVGVGNSVGVGNDAKAAIEAERLVRRVLRRLKRKRRKKAFRLWP
jgi:hypothetical protein